jgi:hypothetical protein
VQLLEMKAYSSRKMARSSQAAGLQLQRIIPMNICLPVSIALYATISHAQEVSFDTVAVRAACHSGGDTCVETVRAAIAAIEAGGDNPTDLNLQFGVLAGLLLELARTAPTMTLAVFAQAMSAISGGSTDPVQKALLASLVADLNAGYVPAALSTGSVNGLSNS